MAIRTAYGRGVPGDYDHFGVRVFRDLVGRTSYLGLVAFGLTGQKLAPEDEALLDDVAACFNVTEPRVWPIKLSRLVATLGRATPGVLCGLTALDSDLVGGRVTENATRQLLEIAAMVDEASDRDEALRQFVLQRERIIGFGVPFRAVDERLVALRAALERRGRTRGTYWRLTESLWSIAKQLRGLEPNIASAGAALFLDLGFRPEHVGAMMLVLLQPTFVGNAAEGARMRSEELRQLPSEAVRYVGPAPRVSPRALAAKK
jgi:hypothetical protein